MKRYQKRLSLLLALVMVLSLIPAVLAEEGGEEPPEVLITSAEELERYGNDGIEQYLFIDQDLTLTESITVTDNDYITANTYMLEEPTPDGDMRFYTLRVAEGCTLNVPYAVDLAINNAEDLAGAARVVVAEGGSKNLYFQGEIYLDHVLELKDEDALYLCSGCRLTLGENGCILGNVFNSIVASDFEAYGKPVSYKFGGYGYVLYQSEDETETYAGYYGTEAALVEGLRSRPDGYPQVLFVILTSGLADETGSVVVKEQWPHVDQVLIQDGSDLVVAAGGSLDVDYLFLQSDVTGWEENPAELRVEDGGSLNVQEYAEIQGSAYYGAGAEVYLGGNQEIFGEYPALCFRWLDNDGGQWYENEDSAFETGYRIVPGQEFWHIYYARTWQDDQWIWTPVQPDAIEIEGGTLSLTPVTELGEAVRAGEANGNCFVMAACREFYEDYTISAAVNGQTVTMQADSNLGDVEFYSAPDISTETFLDHFDVNPLKENVFYLGINLPEDADYHVDGVVTHYTDGSPLSGQDRVTVETVQENRLYKITVKPETVLGMGETDGYFDLEFAVRMFGNQDDSRWIWNAGIGIGTTSALGWKDGAVWYDEENHVPDNDAYTASYYDHLEGQLTGSLALTEGETRDGVVYMVNYDWDARLWRCDPYPAASIWTSNEDAAGPTQLPSDWQDWGGLESTLTAGKPGTAELYTKRWNENWDGETDPMEDAWLDAPETWTIPLTVTVTAKPVKPDKPTPSKPSTSTTTTPAKPEIPFTDVKVSDWFYEDVKYVYENGLMNGTSDTKFSPYSTLTRAMVVTVLYRVEGEPAARYNGTFSDVADYQWYTSAVEWAAKNEIVTGYTTGKFGPNDAVTREQLAAILYRYAEYKGYDVTGSDSLSGCTDSASISAYAVSAAKWAVDGDMLLVTGSKLRPREAANRAEVAAAMASFYAAYVE